jgi:hypothetical protein
MVYRHFTFLQLLPTFISFFSLISLIFWPSSVHSLPLSVGVTPVESASIPRITDIPSKYGPSGRMNLLLSKREYSQFAISEGFGGTALRQASILFEGEH